MTATLLLITFTSIQLADPLDEPEYYCLDVSGWGEKLKIDDPVQAHTCKGEKGSDQHFFFDDARIKLSGTDRCLEVAATRSVLPGSALTVRQCSENPMQTFELRENGQIEAGDTDFCVVAGKDSAEAYGPSHRWRVLTVDNCAEAEPSISTWLSNKHEAELGKRDKQD